MEKARRGRSNLIDGCNERGFICLGWLSETADLAHELKRSCADLFVRYGRIEVEEDLDIAAHSGGPPFGDHIVIRRLVTSLLYLDEQGGWSQDNCVEFGKYI